MFRLLPPPLRPFRGTLAVVLALAWTTLSFGAALAPAPVVAGEGAYYRAELTTAAAETRVIASGLLWSCDGNGCSAAKAGSRPTIVCARLARQVGPIAAFHAGNEALEEKQLAKCNG